MNKDMLYYAINFIIIDVHYAVRRYHIHLNGD